jgi:hypothetical protein
MLHTFDNTTGQLRMDGLSSRVFSGALIYAADQYRKAGLQMRAVCPAVADVAEATHYAMANMIAQAQTPLSFTNPADADTRAVMLPVVEEPGKWMMVTARATVTQALRAYVNRLVRSHAYPQAQEAGDPTVALAICNQMIQQLDPHGQSVEERTGEETGEE